MVFENLKLKNEILNGEKELKEKLHKYVGEVICNYYNINSIKDFETNCRTLLNLQSVINRESNVVSNFRIKSKPQLDSNKDSTILKSNEYKKAKTHILNDINEILNLLTKNNISKSEMSRKLNKDSNYLANLTHKTFKLVNDSSRSIKSIKSREELVNNILNSIKSILTIKEKPLQTGINNVTYNDITKLTNLIYNQLDNSNQKINLIKLSIKLGFSGSYINNILWKAKPKNLKKINDKTSLYNSLKLINDSIAKIINNEKAKNTNSNQNVTIKTDTVSKTSIKDKKELVESSVKSLTELLEKSTKTAQQLSKMFGKDKHYITKLLMLSKNKIQSNIDDYLDQIKALISFVKETLDLENLTKSKLKKLEDVKPLLISDRTRKVIVAIINNKTKSIKYYASSQDLDHNMDSYLTLNYSTEKYDAKLLDLNAASKFYKGYLEESPNSKIAFEVIDSSEIKNFK